MSKPDEIKIWPADHRGIKVSFNDDSKELTEAEAINLAYRAVLHLADDVVLSGLASMWRAAREREQKRKEQAAKEFAELLDTVSRSYFNAEFNSLSEKTANIVEDFAKAKLEIKKLEGS